MEHIINIEGKTVKKWHDGYSFMRKMDHLDDEFVAKIEPTWQREQFEKVDGVWYRPTTVQFAIEFTDGTFVLLDSCGCCDGVVVEEL